MNAITTFLARFVGSADAPAATKATTNTHKKRFSKADPSSQRNRHAPAPDSVAQTPNHPVFPSLAEFHSAKNQIESFLESSESSEFDSLPLMTFPGDEQVTVRKAFRMMKTDKSLEELVTAISMDAAVWDAMTSNKVVQNYLQTGAIRGQHHPTAEDQEKSGSWDPNKSTSIIGAIIDELVAKSGDSSMELNESNSRKLQLAFIISTVIFVGELEKGREKKK